MLLGKSYGRENISTGLCCKKSACKSPCAIQAHVVQGSVVALVLLGSGTRNIPLKPCDHELPARGTESVV